MAWCVKIVGLFCTSTSSLAGDWFSIWCRETKTSVITLANHREHRQSSEPIKTRITCSLRKARENACEKVTRDWMKKLGGVLSQSGGVVDAKLHYFSALK